MALLGWLVMPSAIVLAVALGTRAVLLDRNMPSPGRVGVLALAAGARSSRPSSRPSFS
jgi:hypothetical protein